MPTPLRLALKTLLGSVIILAIALFFAQDQETLRIRSAIAAEDPNFPDYLAALTGAPSTRDDEYVVLRNGDEIFPAMLEAIERAEERISFETFIYSPGQVADQFTAGLTAAAARGVSVHIILDAIGAQDIEPSHLEGLAAAGAQVVWFNQTTWYTLEEINYRTHRKVLVIDGRVGFTGGVSVADHWLGDAGSPDEWRDTHFEVKGAAVRLLEAGFYENWIESAGEAEPRLSLPLETRPLSELDPPPDPAGTVPAAAGSRQDPARAARSVVIWSSPTGGSNGMKRMYLLSMAAARDTLDIVSPYIVLDESSRWALEEAVRRGVRIRILTESDRTDAKPVKFASRSDYEWLLRLGVALYEYQPTMMHTKAIVVDGIWSVIGSSNFDNRSLELNDELNIGVYDRELAATLTRQLEEDLRRSRQLRLDEWLERPLADKARERLWDLFSELF